MIYEVYYRLTTLINSPEFLQSVFDNRFYLILLVIILTRFKYATYNSMWMCSLVNVPGTILHETMHFVVGYFLNARPCNFTILPRRSVDGGYVMGAVGFRNITFYNAVPAAMAPLLLLPIGYYINELVLPLMPATLLNYVLYVLLQTIIIENAVPSSQDVRVATCSFPGLLLYMVFFGALFLMWLGL